jgi:hypothetical protein
MAYLRYAPRIPGFFNRATENYCGILAGIELIWFIKARSRDSDAAFPLG